jgi:HPt (histidine-containing phosphotransfer) domain-containing protein
VEESNLLSTTTANNEVFDTSHLKAMLGDNETIIQELLKIFVTSTAPMLDQMDVAISKKHFFETKKLGHQLKGTAANLGAKQLQVLAKELEAASLAEDSTQLAEIYVSIRSSFDALATWVENRV